AVCGEADRSRHVCGGCSGAGIGRARRLRRAGVAGNARRSGGHAAGGIGPPRRKGVTLFFSTLSGDPERVALHFFSTRSGSPQASPYTFSRRVPATRKRRLTFFLDAFRRPASVALHFFSTRSGDPQASPYIFSRRVPATRK